MDVVSEPLAIKVVGVWHRKRCALFVSVCFRTIDLAVCPVFSLGTHFLWHLLNGAVIYLTMRCLILQRTSTVTS